MREYLTVHGACSAWNITPFDLFVSHLDDPVIYSSVTRLEAQICSCTVGGNDGHSLPEAQCLENARL